MEREKLVRVTTDLAVGAVAAWTLKQLGLRQGSVAALVVGIAIHEMLDAPVATAIQRNL